MDSADYGEFQKLMQMPLPILADKTKTILARKYALPDVPNDSSSEFDFGNRTINLAYHVASKKPELLAINRCYSATCENLQLPNLATCFFNQGRAGDYSLLAARDDICCREALLIFLWNDLGASQNTIDGALRLMFDPSVSEAPATSLN
jgi:hypothetical protein